MINRGRFYWLSVFSFTLVIFLCSLHVLYFPNFYQKTMTYYNVYEKWRWEERLNEIMTSEGTYKNVALEAYLQKIPATQYTHFLRDPKIAAYKELIAIYADQKNSKEKYYINELIKFSPLDPNGYFLLGNYLFKQKDYDGAEKALRQSFAIKPDNVELVSLLKELYQMSGDYESNKYVDEVFVLASSKRQGHLRFFFRNDETNFNEDFLFSCERCIHADGKLITIEIGEDIFKKIDKITSFRFDFIGVADAKIKIVDISVTDYNDSILYTFNGDKVYFDNLKQVENKLFLAQDYISSFSLVGLDLPNNIKIKLSIIVSYNDI